VGAGINVCGICAREKPQAKENEKDGEKVQMMMVLRMITEHSARSELVFSLYPSL
jgi:hypothetical protein